MEILKTDILKNEFEKFQKENLVQILECGYFQKNACESFHRKFLVNCKFCMETFCNSCHNFNMARKYFLKDLIKLEKNILKTLLKIFLV